MSLSEVLAEQRRLEILEALHEMDERRLNETTMLRVLDAMGSPADKEQIRSDLSFLERHRLVRLEKLPHARGEIWVAILSDEGERVRRGRPHEGVKRGGGF